MLLYGFVAGGRRYEGPSLRVALMQPNIRSVRGEPGSAEKDLALFDKMAEDVARERPEIIIWPETIAPGDAVNDADIRRAFARMAVVSHAWVLVGTGYADEMGRPYNSAALFAPDGRLTDRYDKHWLVPMGEWIVGRSWLPFGGVFHFPKYDTVPGITEAPLVAGRARMAALICYESIFPIMARTRILNGANLLVLITNDSWAGESSELWQHAAMTAFRAVETRTYVASAATTGITAVIDPWGRVNSIPPYKEGHLIAEPRLLESKTPYTLFGDWLILVCAAGIAAVLWRGKGARGVGISEQSP